MLHEQGKNHHRIFTPLTFVDRHCPGQRQFGEIGVVVAHQPLSELHHHLLLFQIDGGDGAQVAIEDFSLVIVDLLDHSVSNS